MAEKELLRLYERSIERAKIALESLRDRPDMLEYLKACESRLNEKKEREKALRMKQWRKDLGLED